MREKILIFTVGYSTIESKTNLGPIKGTLMYIPPNEIFRAHFLADKVDDEIIKEIENEFSYLKEKTEINKIDAFDYESLIREIIKIYVKYKDKTCDFIVNISGGTKIMSIGAFIGANLIGAQTQYIKSEKVIEEFGDPAIIEIYNPKVPLNSLSLIEKTILFILKDKENKNKKKNNNKDKDKTGKSNKEEFLSQNQLILEMNKKKWQKTKKNLRIKKFNAQNISYHISKLEKNKLIERRVNETNKRAYELHLTNYGLMLADYLQALE